MSNLPSSAPSHQTISVVVSEEEHDKVDPRVRLVRGRRKRRKQPLMASRRWKKNVILHTAIRKFLKWWPFILLIPAVGLLVFEAWRTFGSDHRGPVRSQMWALSMGLNGSLDSVDPVMRVVNGDSEPSLMQSMVTLVDVLKMGTSKDEDDFTEGNAIAVVGIGPKIEIILFSVGGCLKLLPAEQLENLEIPSVETPSYPVTRVVYISDTDRSSIGGNATLTMEPMEPSRFNLFSGYQTLAEREQSFKDIGYFLKHGIQFGWTQSQFQRDPLGVLETLLWRTNSVLAISEHGARSSIYDEGKAVVRKHKATPEEMAVQLSQYHQDGFPDDRRFNGKKALAEASVIVREHTPLTNLLMCLWFNEVVRFTSRDQLSFPYVLRQLGVLKNVNFFPVCTRKDLVNSMGHKRKARTTLPS